MEQPAAPTGHPRGRGTKLAIVGGVVAVLVLCAMIIGVYALRRGGVASKAENQARTAGNARAILRACRLYAADNLGYFPPHLAAAIPYGIAPEMLVDRLTGTAAMPVPGEVALTDWRRHAAAVDAHCDFVYTGDRVRDSDPAAIIVLCTKPAVASNGRLLGFVDGRADFVFAADLARVLADDAAARAEKKRPAMTLDGAPGAGGSPALTSPAADR